MEVQNKISQGNVGVFLDDLLYSDTTGDCGERVKTDTVVAACYLHCLCLACQVVILEWNN